MRCGRRSLMILKRKRDRNLDVSIDGGWSIQRS